MTLASLVNTVSFSIFSGYFRKQNQLKCLLYNKSTTLPIHYVYSTEKENSGGQHMFHIQLYILRSLIWGFTACIRGITCT